MDFMIKTSVEFVSEFGIEIEFSEKKEKKG